MLAARRLTEAQLWSKLVARDYTDDEVRVAVEACKADGFIDDVLFARLFVECRPRALGDARLVAELVRRGIEREAARRSVADAEDDQPARLERAIEKIFRTRGAPSYPSVARSLERLGFPSPAVYRALRERAAREPLAEWAAEDSFASAP